MICRFAGSTALLVLLAAASVGAAPPVEWNRPTISSDTSWSGRILIRENVVVSPGATLRILPGASVQVEPGKGIGLTVLGRLLVEGRKGEEVSIGSGGKEAAPPGWEGIRLHGDKGAGHSLQGFRIGGAREGVALNETSARVSGGVFSSCEVGIRANRESAVDVDACTFDGGATGAAVTLGAEGEFRGCRFQDFSANGIVAERGGTLRVSGCTFLRGGAGVVSLTESPTRVEGSVFRLLETGIVARQAGSGTSITRCTFENDNTGILAVQFCEMEISDSAFRENGTGVDAREFSRPRIHHNRFEANGAGVNLFRKSHSRIESNLFVRNRNAVVVNFSSYPMIRGNNFDKNDMSIRLEKFQSGDWEEREGSTALSGAEAKMRGSRNAGAAGEAVRFPRRVTAKENYWGTDVVRDPAKGTMDRIRDGRSYGPVRYEGFGGEYAIDVVDFGEESPVPFPDAGPRAAPAGGVR